MKYLCDKKLHDVKAIFWTIYKSPKKTDILREQAKLIDKFKPGEIWNNVVIICKQARNPDKDAQGALKIAEEFLENNENNIKVIGYTFTDDPHWTEEQQKYVENWKPDDRRIFNILTTDEVRSRIYDTISNLKAQKINLYLKRCDACGFEGDERLKPRTCHGKFNQTHKLGKLCPTHRPNSLGKRHTGSVQVMRVHSDKLNHPFLPLTDAVFECCNGTKDSVGCQEKEVMSCCGKSKGSEGCESYHKCCLKKENGEGCQEHYPCCEGMGQDAPGCVKRCIECQGLWGTEAQEHICSGRHQFESKEEVNQEN